MPRPARVIHVSTVRPPLEVRVFHHECKSLVAAGYDVELIIHDGAEDRIVDGIKIRTLGTKPARRGLLLWSRARAVWKAKQRIQTGVTAEIVHLHDPELIPLGWWLRLATKSKIIYDSAENYTAYMRQKYFLPAPVRWGLTYIMAAMETLAARLFHAVVTADQGTSNLFIKRRAKKVVTVHNFPILEVFDVAVTPDAEKRYDLVYHGSIPKYHLEAALQIATELQRRGCSARWLFVGACHDLDWILAQLRNQGLEGNFTFRGRVHHDQVAPLVAQARIGFIPLPDLPKFHQNIPMKLFEFMTLRMPVVLTDLPPSRPFVGDGECAVMVPPDDPVAFADAIEGLLNDHASRKRMGEAGRQRVEATWNWSAESQKLLDLYDALISTEE